MQYEVKITEIIELGNLKEQQTQCCTESFQIKQLDASYCKFGRCYSAFGNSCHACSHEHNHGTISLLVTMIFYSYHLELKFSSTEITYGLD